jgi:hypothetical protein
MFSSPGTERAGSCHRAVRGIELVKIIRADLIMTGIK